MNRLKKDDKSKQNNKLKYIVIGIFTLVIIGAIAGALWVVNEQKSGTTRQMEGDSSIVEDEHKNDLDKDTDSDDNKDIVEINYKVPKDAANLQYMLDITQDLVIETTEDTSDIEGDGPKQSEVIKISLSEESPEVSSLVIAGNSDNKVNITRYQLASVLYKILLNVNKLPDIYGYQVSYEDNEGIPERYVDAVCYTTYLKLTDYGTKFEGYRYVTKDEVRNAFNKLQSYLLNYEDSNDTDIEDEVNEKSEERIKLEQEAAEILSKRKFKDTLNGKSVATFSTPKTLEQLEVNQNAVLKLDIDELSLFDYGETEQVVDVEYVNLDEVLLDYSLIHGDILRNITGVTYGTQINAYFNSEIKDEIILIQSNQFEKALGKQFLGTQIVYGIKDNNIVCEINYIAENGLTGLIIPSENNDIDSLGVLVNTTNINNVRWGHALDTGEEGDITLCIIKLNGGGS